MLEVQISQTNVAPCDGHVHVCPVHCYRCGVNVYNELILFLDGDIISTDVDSKGNSISPYWEDYVGSPN